MEAKQYHSVVEMLRGMGENEVADDVAETLERTKFIRVHAVSWNYRLVRLDDGEGNVWFDVREVFYDECGKITNCSKSPVMMQDDEVEHFTWMLDHMREALDKPILDESELPK